ncbi:Maf family protein [Prochlorothrix hollandica]|uniref:Nucleoside triphosphate pyrophosphatase n=1 Tax=Prochlorothrix hollandica PCC 9006 = CALU 1027 TaxID=317619 RepID=A0A0M2PW02_PROHO|nr:nucleoside triphosphate pyrophosphatase [Prochlorothrix hollandica]KKI99277.1 septum formation protein Maf [Prochlorothrix hollandica PCC 9006 = CALU 1027]
MPKPVPLPPFVLASASPARRRLLQLAGIDPLVQPSHFDEDQVQTHRPGELVHALAKHKASAIAADWVNQGKTHGLILGCDSILALNGEIHGKPADEADAIARWQQMRGQRGELYTGHALIDLGQGRSIVHTAITQVHFANVTDGEIRAYVATGEPLNCAGCFALEGRGGLFIDRLEGCHTNVIGLSLPLLRRMLAELGYGVMDFWPGD